MPFILFSCPAPSKASLRLYLLLTTFTYLFLFLFWTRPEIQISALAFRGFPSGNENANPEIDEVLAVYSSNFF